MCIARKSAHKLNDDQECTQNFFDDEQRKFITKRHDLSWKSALDLSPVCGIQVPITKDEFTSTNRWRVRAIAMQLGLLHKNR